VAETFIKRLELAVRRIFNARAGSAGQPILVSDVRDVIGREALHRVLLLRQDRIGDVLISTPVIRALRRLLPDAQIDMVMSTNNISVRQAIDSEIDHVFVFRKSLLHLLLLRRALRRRRYDLVIDLMDNASSTSALLISGAQARMAIGVDKVNRGVYTHVVPLADQTRVHIVERICRLLWPLGVDLRGEDLRLSFPLTDVQRSAAKALISDGSQLPVLAVNISGSDVHRMYPETMMIELLRQISDRWAGPEKARVQLCILSAPMHAEMARRIGIASGISVVEPQTSYPMFAACLASADMLLTPDTSAVHAAAAYRVPSVVLFSQDSRGIMPWFPYGTPCWPCVTARGALETIPVEDIVHAVDQMIVATTENKPGHA
jgi:heptosyltransferase IV